MRRITGIAAVALLAMGTAAMGQATKPTSTQAKLPFTISKETTAIMGPLRADGTVDYVAALNEKYGKGVTPENNGFVVWLQVVGTDAIPGKLGGKVLKMCGAVEDPAGAVVWKDYGSALKASVGLSGAELDKASDELKTAGSELWETKDHPRVAEFLKEQEKSLGIATVATARLCWWTPYVSSDGRSFANIQLLQLVTVREVADAFLARATMRARAGDFDGFLADIMAVRRLARHVSGAMLMERLNGLSLEVAADKAVGAAAGAGIFSAEQCARLNTAMGDAADLPSIWEAVDVGERWSLLDSVELWAMGNRTDADNPLGALFFGDVEGFDQQAVQWDVILKALNHEVDGIVTGLKAPTYSGMKLADDAIQKRRQTLWSTWKGANDDRSAKREAGETADAYSTRVAGGIFHNAMLAMAGAERLRREALMQKEMLQTMLAAAEVKAKTGAWPGRLEDLVPQAIKIVPKDMYSKNEADAVKYVVKTGGMQLYSVGRNGKDDGGVMDRANGKDDIGVGVK